MNRNYLPEAALSGPFVFVRVLGSNCPQLIVYGLNYVLKTYPWYFTYFLRFNGSKYGG